MLFAKGQSKGLGLMQGIAGMLYWAHAVAVCYLMQASALMAILLQMGLLGRCLRAK